MSTIFLWPQNTSLQRISKTFQQRQFYKVPRNQRFFNSWTLNILSIVLQGKQFRGSKAGSLYQDNKKKIKKKKSWNSGLCCPSKSESLLLPGFSVPPDILSPLESQELCLCRVLLARVMPRRQRNISRKSFKALCIGLWQGSTWLNKNQPDAVSPRWICNNLGGSNFLGDWHNYTQTNCLNSHIFINTRLKLKFEQTWRTTVPAAKIARSREKLSDT